MKIISVFEKKFIQHLKIIFHQKIQIFDLFYVPLLRQQCERKLKIDAIFIEKK